MPRIRKPPRFKLPEYQLLLLILAGLTIALGLYIVERYDYRSNENGIVLSAEHIKSQNCETNC